MFLMVLFFLFIVIESIYAQTDNRLNGRWFVIENGIEVEYRFNNGNYETFIDGTSSDRGTYVTNNGSISMTLTHMFGAACNTFLGPIFEALSLSGYESKWYSTNEFIITTRQLLSGLELSDKDFNDFISEMISSETMTYSVDANTLILLSAMGTHILTKK
jgi:hypothetical protein